MRARVMRALAMRATRELGPGATVLDYACKFVAEGGRIGQLATLLAQDLGEPVSRPFVSGILNNLTDDAKSRLAEARRESAMALVEEAAQIADDAEPTTGAVQKARLQVGTRQWMAERFAPEEFGGKPGVVVDMGQLFLEALRQPPPPRPPQPDVRPPADKSDSSDDSSAQ
jgi:hypothetical protein